MASDHECVILEAHHTNFPEYVKPHFLCLVWFMPFLVYTCFGKLSQMAKVFKAERNRGRSLSANLYIVLRTRQTGSFRYIVYKQRRFLT